MPHDVFLRSDHILSMTEHRWVLLERMSALSGVKLVAKDYREWSSSRGLVGVVATISCKILKHSIRDIGASFHLVSLHSGELSTFLRAFASLVFNTWSAGNTKHLHAADCYGSVKNARHSVGELCIKSLIKSLQVYLDVKPSNSPSLIECNSLQI